MKKLILFILTLTACHIFPQSTSFKVIEIRGNIDIKDRSGEWKTPAENDFLLNGTEIFTGLHSHISLQVGEESYITINQLSNVILDTMRIQREEINSEIYLVNGFVVVNTKDTETFKTRLTISFMDGRAVFQKSGGDVYIRKEYGALIRAGSGRVNVVTQTVNRYNIRKNEQCAILPGGRLLKNDYFLMRNISSPAVGPAGNMETDLYHDKFHNYYSNIINNNDHGKR